jgi:hypothetical protein
MSNVFIFQLHAFFTAQAYDSPALTADRQRRGSGGASSEEEEEKPDFD